MKSNKSKIIPSYIQRILKENGIFNYEKFLHPNISDLYPFQKLTNLDKAAEIINQHIEKQNKILIFSHDDGDGITASAILNLFFEQINFPVIHYIPNRKYDAIGLTTEKIDKFSQDGINLIITVDGCIKNVEAVDYAKSKNIEVIITDHHIPGESLPNTLIINPKLDTCNYPFDLLAGVSVAYKLFLQLCNSKAIDSTPNFLDVHKKALVLAMIGTVTDKVKLIDENRLIVQLGLTYFNEIEMPFKNILLKEMNGKISFENISKVLGILNNGREKNGKHLGCDFLITKELSNAENVFKIMKERYSKFKEDIGFWKNKLKIELNLTNRNNKLIIHVSDKIPSTIHSSLCNEILNFGKDVVVLLVSTDDGTKAEARAIQGYDLVAMFDKVNSLLLQYGGHKLAAGFSIDNEKIEGFQKEFKAVYDEYIPSQPKSMSYQKPIKIREKFIDVNFINYLERIKPFLFRYSTHLFQTEDASVRTKTFLVKNKFYLKVLEDDIVLFSPSKIK